jgi:hypothetical protein
MTAELDDGALMITLPVNLAAEDARVVIEISTYLQPGQWQALPATLESRVESAPGQAESTWRAPPPPGATRLFVRGVLSAN